MSDITLPRAVGLHIRNSLRGIVNASDDDCGEEKCRECAPVRVMREALAALDAALAEPGSALQVDAERYRWIADNAMAIDFVADPDNMVQIWHGTDPARFSAGKTLDEAVDAARRKT